MQRTQKVAVYYRSNGKLVPFKTYTGKVRTFTSSRELSRFLNSGGFNFEKNYILKSKVTVRKYQA